MPHKKSDKNRMVTRKVKSAKKYATPRKKK